MAMKTFSKRNQSIRTTVNVYSGLLSILMITTVGLVAGNMTHIQRSAAGCDRQLCDPLLSKPNVSFWPTAEVAGLRSRPPTVRVEQFEVAAHGAFWVAARDERQLSGRFVALQS